MDVINHIITTCTKYHTNGKLVQVIALVSIVLDVLNVNDLNKWKVWDCPLQADKITVETSAISVSEVPVTKF